jgi:murein DD-endopeptidase MepM/ murein hydrolase activator NlpD
MLSLHAIPLALQFGVPILLLVWFARGRHASLSQWLGQATIILLYLRAVHVAGLWVLLPWYTAAVFAAGLVAIALLQVQRVRRLPWRAPRVAWRSLLSSGIIATFAVAVLVTAAVARRPPQDYVIDLQFPLRHGVYHVVGGGSVELLNPHVMTLTADRYRAHRGQSYGVDLVKLGTFGMRATGWLPTDLARYVIYGDPVYAPCSGVVVQSDNGAPDMPPPEPDRTRMPGNHVLLDCDGVHVLIAHLKPGTVRARPGQWIEAGASIGLVGNSGNSNEPHLHVHAQRPASAGHEPLSGDALPMRFDGRYLIRNDRVTGVKDSAGK